MDPAGSVVLIDWPANLLKEPQPGRYIKSLLIAIGKNGKTVLNIGHIL